MSGRLTFFLACILVLCALSLVNCAIPGAQSVH